MTALINPFWYGATTTDPSFANVVLLLHCDGTNGSTTITDSSSRVHVPNATLNSSLTTAQQKFGTASWGNSASNGAIQYVDDPDWDFGAGQFTVEAWIRSTGTISGQQYIFSQFRNSSSTNQAWAVRFNGAAAPGYLDFVYTTNGSTEVYVSGAYLPPTNTWTHLAVDRDASNVVRLYADGVVKGSGTAAATIFNSTRPLHIGNDALQGTGFIGQIDDVRITKGVGRYGGAFTPPTAAFPNS
jgi:hypothetical protein